MPRQIIVDTETTGLESKQGHRIIEIACLEVIDRNRTGNDFHYFLNPEREIDAGALAVHGISREFLEDKPLFAEIADELLSYLNGAELLIHNAPFDIGFINCELSLCAASSRKLEDVCTIQDTLALARSKHPGKRNSLDALCKRYRIDNSSRTLHGAMLDVLLLYEVYRAMTSGQVSLIEAFGRSIQHADESTVVNRVSEKETTPVIYASDEEIENHQNFLTEIKIGEGGCVWLDEFAERDFAIPD